MIVASIADLFPDPLRVRRLWKARRFRGKNRPEEKKGSARNRDREQ